MMGAPGLAAQAVAMAARVRVSAGIAANVPLCIYDLIDRWFGEEVDLRFQPLPSLEGMYSRQRDSTGIIVVSSDRPGGRRRYTCAHELGHHLFKHQVSVDELVEEKRDHRSNPREFLVDLFAGYLLMPKLAILRAARERGIDLTRPTAEDIYRLASYFGVGYNTLLTHASRSIRVLDEADADRLARRTPQSIREKLLGYETSRDLVLADTAWGPSRPVDAVVGDHVVLPRGAVVERALLKRVGSVLAGDLYEATTPGIARAELDGTWSAFIRVECYRYKGMVMFRNLEESDEE